jgi:hypothetical protein
MLHNAAREGFDLAQLSFPAVNRFGCGKVVTNAYPPEGQRVRCHEGTPIAPHAAEDARIAARHNRPSQAWENGDREMKCSLLPASGSLYSLLFWY